MAFLWLTEDTTAEGTTGADGDTMVTVRVTQTYDLSTAVNKMGILGIHTPPENLIRRLYGGFLLNYNKFKLDKCDLACACASVQPADPLQVGVQAGDIAPQDLFNPILYRACTNDSFNTIINRVYSYSSGQTVQNNSIVTSGNVGSDAFPNLANQTDVYYSLLAEDGWRKAMPQTGFSMTNVRPLVYNVLSQYGNTQPVAVTSSSNIASVRVTGSANTGTDTAGVNLQTFIRGNAQPMPALPTGYGYNIADSDTTADWGTAHRPVEALIPPTWCGVIIMPPAALHILYFRISISWTISFFDPISTTEKFALNYLNTTGAMTHIAEYTIGSSKETYEPAEEKMETSEDVIDSIGVNTLKKVMTK